MVVNTAAGYVLSLTFFGALMCVCTSDDDNSPQRSDNNGGTSCLDVELTSAKGDDDDAHGDGDCRPDDEGNRLLRTAPAEQPQPPSGQKAEP
eukprot:5063731-Pyramimonas_sp.AAC.1